MSASSKGKGGARAGRAKVDELRQAQQAKERRSRLILIGAVTTVVALIAGVVGFTVWRDVSTRPSLDAVKKFDVTREHTTEPGHQKLPSAARSMPRVRMRSSCSSIHTSW